MLSCGEPPFGDPGKEQLCGKAWCGSPSLTFSCSICFYSSFYFEGKKGPPMGTLLDITANFHIPVTRFTSCQPLAVLALLFLLSHGQHHCDHCFLLYCFLISLKVLRGMCSFLSLRCQHYVPERRTFSYPTTLAPCFSDFTFRSHCGFQQCASWPFYLPIRLRPAIMHHICFHLEHSIPQRALFFHFIRVL